jgi:phage baseplate assembly protein W
VATIKVQSIQQPARAKSNFTYTDLLLDIKLDFTKSNEFLKKKEIKDLKIDYDYAAIRNSIYNILTTIPGQRILNPNFGLGVQKYLFLPVNEDTGLAIGNEILRGINTFEPRVKIENINVATDEVNQQYVITLILTMLAIDPISFKLVGVLSNTGFNFVNN